MRTYREQVRDTYQDLASTQQRLQRQVVPDAERDELVTKWSASGPEDLIQKLGWRIQALREQETSLVEQHQRRDVYNPVSCIDALMAALDGDEPPTRYEIWDELAYVQRELRRSGSSTLVY
jgi:phosphoenolpyruvate carboxylase